MLTAFREVAATALTLKKATAAGETVDSIVKLDPENIRSNKVEEMEKLFKAVRSLSSMNELIRQLSAAKDQVEGANDGHSSLLEKRSEILAWLNTLCPSFETALSEVESFANQAIPSDIESANFQHSSESLPKEENLHLPDSVDGCFVLRCFLA